MRARSDKVKLAKGTPMDYAEFDLEQLRKRLHMMTDIELLAFRHSVERICAPNASGGPTLEKFRIQLEESKAEWGRRYFPT